MTDRSILIRTITNYVGNHIKKENKELAKHNLHCDQKPFNETELFFKLVFKSDDDLKLVVDQIII